MSGRAEGILGEGRIERERERERERKRERERGKLAKFLMTSMQVLNLGLTISEKRERGEKNRQLSKTFIKQV